MSKKGTKETPEQKVRRLTKENKELTETITGGTNENRAQANHIHGLGDEIAGLKQDIAGLKSNIEVFESSKRFEEKERVRLEAELKEREKQLRNFQEWTTGLLKDMVKN